MDKIVLTDSQMAEMDKIVEEKGLDFFSRVIVLQVDIEFDDVNWSDPIRKFVPNELMFKEVKLFGARVGSFYRTFEIAIYHPKFPERGGNINFPVYSIDEAKEKFPFIFREG